MSVLPAFPVCPVCLACLFQSCLAMSCPVSVCRSVRVSFFVFTLFSLSFGLVFVRSPFLSFFLFDLVPPLSLYPAVSFASPGPFTLFFQTRTHMKDQKTLDKFTAGTPPTLSRKRTDRMRDSPRCFGVTQAKLPPGGFIIRSSAKSVSRSCRKPEGRCGASQDPKSMASIDVFWSAAKTFSRWWS